MSRRIWRAAQILMQKFGHQRLIRNCQYFLDLLGGIDFFYPLMKLTGQKYWSKTPRQFEGRE